ncbi:hypothetical protein [Propioniciclava flava]
MGGSLVASEGGAGGALVVGVAAGGVGELLEFFGEALELVAVLAGPLLLELAGVVALPVGFDLLEESVTSVTVRSMSWASRLRPGTTCPVMTLTFMPWEMLDMLAPSCSGV